MYHAGSEKLDRFVAVAFWSPRHDFRYPTVAGLSYPTADGTNGQVALLFGCIDTPVQLVHR